MINDDDIEHDREVYDLKDNEKLQKLCLPKQSTGEDTADIEDRETEVDVDDLGMRLAPYIIQFYDYQREKLMREKGIMYQEDQPKTNEISHSEEVDPDGGKTEEEHHPTTSDDAKESHSEEEDSDGGESEDEHHPKMSGDSEERCYSEDQLSHHVVALEIKRGDKVETVLRKNLG